MSPITEQAALELIAAAVSPGGRLLFPRPGAGSSAACDAEIRLANGKRTAIQLKRWGSRSEASDRAECTTVWLLKRAAAEVRQRLRDADESFVDLSGAVRLHLPGLLIDRSDLGSVQVTEPAGTRNPFTDRASRVARTLFDAPSESTWRIQELAEAAGVSLGMTSYVVNALSQRGVIAVQTAGREKRVRLTDPKALLSQWTTEYTWRRNHAQAFDAPVGSPRRFLRRLPGLLRKTRWALTLQAGASLVAPHAGWETVHLYVDTTLSLRMVGMEAGWTPSGAGRLVLLRPYYLESAWFGLRRIESVPVVSDLQLILDLWHYPVRGREQAELLLDRHAGTAD